MPARGGPSRASVTMPSARELLEQADALMRRNRSPLMDDIPVLTDSVRAIPPGRPVQPRRNEPDFDAPDTIPMLTDSVADAPEESVPPAPDPVKDAVVEEGEPSDWLQLGGAEPSIIGEAPDSIAIVPPVAQAMSEEIEVTCRDLGIAEERIHVERFVSEFGGKPRPKKIVAPDAPPKAIASLIIDGKRRDVPVAEDEAILDAALRAGVDLPFACKGGMCSTCRAKLVEGEAPMDINYSLEPWELKAGFVLTCQAKPSSERVVVDYDHV